MKIKDLAVWESFVQVAQQKSFVGAAKKLSVGPPLLTKHIQALESELGVRLFQRTTRKVSLTQEGMALLPRAKAFIEEATQIELQFQSSKELEGLIRISCITALTHRILIKIILKFNARHPAVRFEVDANDRYVDLIDSQFDLAIRVDEPRGADFVYRRLFPNYLMICASPNYLKNCKKINHPRDLLNHPLLVLDVYRNCKFKNSNVVLSTLFSSRKITTESGLLLTDLAVQGAGVTIRSVWDVRPLIDEGKLIPILEHHELEPFGTVYLVLTGNRLLSKRVRSFVDFFCEQVAIVAN